MAKLENKTTQPAKIAKGKKRKHPPTENEDEVASKSLIIEAKEETEPEQQQQHGENATKAIKRKNKGKNKIKEKRSKKSEEDADSDHEVEEEEEADDHDHGPTLEQLRESEKPENTKSILTVRQKKKQMHQQRLDAQKDQLVGKEKQRNQEYLRKWRDARADWKFEKLRQISIQQSVFDESKMGPDTWPIALEYLSGSKGAAKEKITKLAEDVIDELDKECVRQADDVARQVIVESVRYQRARDLLQSFV